MSILLSDDRRKQLHEQLDALLDQLPAALRNLDDAEQQLADGLRKLGQAGLQAWAEARLSELWDGDRRACRQAVAELRKQRRGAKREALRKLAGYLQYHAERIDYPTYRAAGLPVGSGAVESMCKALVGGRCKQAGMRSRTRRGAEAVLRLRAAQYDGDF